MTKTLIAKLTNLEQYDSASKTVEYKDHLESRWSNTYNRFRINDNAIFLTGSKVIIGIIKSIDSGVSMFCSDVEVFESSNDDFLRIHAIYPELISRVKANFQPFIHSQRLIFQILLKR